jgi:hypothetical protein
LFEGITGAKRGLPEFRASYADDKLPPVPAEARDFVMRMGGCIACGLCDAGATPAMGASEGRYGGTMDLMLASARNMPDYQAAARSFALVDEKRLAILEARCPTRVPMREISAFVRAQGEVLSLDVPPERGR